MLGKSVMSIPGTAVTATHIISVSAVMSAVMSDTAVTLASICARAVSLAPT
jgi:hypothetical protein